MTRNIACPSSFVFRKGFSNRLIFKQDCKGTSSLRSMLHNFSYCTCIVFIVVFFYNKSSIILSNLMHFFFYVLNIKILFEFTFLN